MGKLFCFDCCFSYQLMPAKVCVFVGGGGGVGGWGGWGVVVRADCNNTFIQLMIILLPFLSTCIRFALLCWHLSQCVTSVHQRIKSLNYGEKKKKWYQFSSDGIDLCVRNSPRMLHSISRLFPQHLPLKQLQCFADWWWLFLILSRKSIKHFLIPLHASLLWAVDYWCEVLGLMTTYDLF